MAYRFHASVTRPSARLDAVPQAPGASRRETRALEPVRGPRAALCLLVLSALVSAADAQAPSDGTRPARKAATALPLTGSIAIDGRLTDGPWERAKWLSDFVQKEPVEGVAPVVETRVAFYYSDDALYVAARMQAGPEVPVNAQVTRRDAESNAEQFVVSLDTYHNLRTSYVFGVTAGGVRIDYYQDGDRQSSRDYSFDPVWSAAARVTEAGWEAEMRIPFSQLRFNETREQTWGLNLNRHVPAANQDIYWVMIPRDESGWTSRFGTLEGIVGIRPSSRVEVLPYVATSGVAADQVDPDDPFAADFATTVRAGLDAKVGIGPNLTLDMTVNPDFGQVEADPAVVNLTAFETFFDERRPFFSEGSDLLQGSLFYSRRIGARPRGSVTADYADRPEATTILGAAKLSGRLPGGLSLAAISAATQAEFADTYDLASGTYGRASVEPAAAYSAVAAQQEFGSNASTVRAQVTSVNRFMDSGNPNSPYLSKNAYAGSVGYTFRFRNGAYILDGSANATSVGGTASRIENLQRSPVHYYQRPDASYLTLDTTRTRLPGFATDIYFSKNSGRLTADMFLGVESPGFDPNDLGRLGRADEVASFASIDWRQTEPGPVFHRYVFTVSTFNTWNFGGQKNTTGFDAAVSGTLTNFWSGRIYAGFNPTDYSDAATRGGPRMAIAAERNVGLELGSNSARRASFSLSFYRETDALERQDLRVSGRLRWQPNSRLDLSVSPGYSRFFGNRQYVTSRDGGPQATYGRRYIFALIDRTQLSAQLRLNYTFSPDLTLELYAEPFAASGDYSRPGELAEAGGLDLRVYGEAPGTALEHGAGGSFQVVADGESFALPPLDFNVLSFRSNAVVRWEWRPGSTLYLVWQQNRSGFASTGDAVTAGSLLDALSARGDNFVGMKLSYWLPVN